MTRPARSILYLDDDLESLLVRCDLPAKLRTKLVTRNPRWVIVPLPLDGIELIFMGPSLDTDLVEIAPHVPGRMQLVR